MEGSDNTTDTAPSALKSKAGRRAKVLLIPLAVILSGAIVAGVVILSSTENDTFKNRAVANVSDALEDILSKEDGAVLGNKKAPVTFIEFSDYACPSCAKFFKEIEPQIREKYINTGKVKMVYKNFAFLGPASVRAAEAAACAEEQGKFWQYHDAIFASQDGEHPEYPLEQLRGFASAEGLAMKKFDECVATRKYQHDVEQDMSDARRVGVSGTPTAFINGKKLVGTFPFSDFEKVIEEALLE